MESIYVFSMFMHSSLFGKKNKKKKDCWTLIREVPNNLSLDNIIIVGDLNVVLNASEKKGGNVIRDPIMEWVDDLIQDWDLLDIKPSKGKFTWSNRRIIPGHITARLDRFLVYSSFLPLGLDSSSRILPFTGSDHRPIQLEIKKEKNLGHIPFCFSPLWLQYEGFFEKV
jgi:hypothetical protein